MKQFITLNVFLFIFLPLSFSQNLKFNDFVIMENLPYWLNLDSVKVNDNLIINNENNPFYLESDFNGDNKLDLALVVNNTDNNKKGILIIHGKSYKTYLLGAGHNFGNGGDDFSWMEVWNLYRENNAFKTIFTENYDIDGSEEVGISNVSISVAPTEASRNLITWDSNENKYIWIHTGD